MDFGRSTRTLPVRAVTRSIGHREWWMLTPGAFALMWGMRHGALRSGAPDADAIHRVWTDGYPWRLWLIAQSAPMFATLMGLDPAASDDAWRDAPNVFTRLDYVAALDGLRDPGARIAWLDGLPEPERRVIAAQFLIDPFDSSCKLPVFSEVVGKLAYEKAALLVDDKGANVKRFARTGRRAVRIVSRAPRVVFERVPNSVWRDPEGVLRAMATPVMRRVAAALADVMQDAPCSTRQVDAEPDVVLGGQAVVFWIDIPDAKLRGEWVEPVRAIKSVWIDE